MAKSVPRYVYIIMWTILFIFTIYALLTIFLNIVVLLICAGNQPTCLVFFTAYSKYLLVTWLLWLDWLRLWLGMEQIAVIFSSLFSQEFRQSQIYIMAIVNPLSWSTVRRGGKNNACLGGLPSHFSKLWGSPWH